MNIFSKLFNRSGVAKIPYLGGEKAPRPYLDWYVLVAVSLACLVSLIGGYGYLVMKITKQEPLPADVLIERSLSKIKPGQLERISVKIEEKERVFLELVASSTPVVDPSR